MIYDTLPYSNFHEMNLDLVMQLVVKLPPLVEQIHKELHDEQTFTARRFAAVRNDIERCWHYIRSIEIELDTFQGQITAQQTAFITAVNQYLAGFKAELGAFTKYVDSTNAGTRAWTSGQLTALDAKFTALYKASVLPGNIWNIFAQDNTTTREYFDDWWKYARVGSASAALVHLARMTAAQLDNQNMSAAEYDFDSGRRYAYDNQRAFDPVTGEFSPYYKIIDDLAAYARAKGAPASAYDEAGFTAEEYGNYFESAFGYDFDAQAGIDRKSETDNTSLDNTRL